MGIFDRIILTIYTFVLTFFALGVVLIGLRLFPMDLIGTGITYLYGRWEASLVGAVFFLVSIRLLLAGSRSQHNKVDTLVLHNPMGDVHVALDAVENLVAKAARHAQGVRGVKVKAVNNDKVLNGAVQAVISPDNHVPAVTAEIQQLITEHVKHTIGIELTNVRITVENISNDFKGKQRVE